MSRLLTTEKKSLGSFFAVQLAVQQMRKQNTPGSVVFIASITAHCNLPGYRMGGYNMSKGGVKMVSKALSSELAPHGIRVNSISPAFIDTNQTRGAKEHTTKAAGELMNTAPPMGRIGQPDEVSPAACWFLSDASSYVTGADILVSRSASIFALHNANHTIAGIWWHPYR